MNLFTIIAIVFFVFGVLGLIIKKKNNEQVARWANIATIASLLLSIIVFIFSFTETANTSNLNINVNNAGTQVVGSGNTVYYGGQQ